MSAAGATREWADCLVETAAARQVLRRGALLLEEAGIESGALDAEALLRDILGIDRAALICRLDDPVSAAAALRYDLLLKRRAAREPLAYLTGFKEFWSRDFVVTPAVLIPRPETELLVELALEDIGRRDRAAAAPRIADIGTGSGCIAVSLAAELPRARIWAVDRSAGALEIAGQNVRRYALDGRVVRVQSDLFGGFDPAQAQFDLILSNPPYIPSRELSDLAPEILGWEPLGALDGGNDGLDVYRLLVADARGYLVPGGWLYLEVGAGMGAAVAELCWSAGGYETVEVFPDYARRDRVVRARRTLAE